MHAEDFEEPSTSKNNASTSITNTLITDVKSKIIDVVISCFRQLTADQWTLLKTCSPDATTKLLMANLILEMVTIVSKAFSRVVVSNTDPSGEQVKNSLGKLVEDCFKTALNITDDVHCENSKRLQELINVQVTLNITAENLYMNITMPKILDAILDAMVKMTTRVKKIFVCRAQWNSASPTADASTQEPQASCDDFNREVPAETSAVLSMSDDKTKEIQTSNKIIQDELNGMIGPLVDEMSESQFDSFQSDSCLKETLVEDIVQELQEDTNPKRGKLKNLFTLQFTKMWLNRIWMQITKKYQNSPTESPIMLAEIPDVILTKLTLEENKQVNSGCLLLKPMPRAGALILTKRLTNFLFQRMMGKNMSVSPRGSLSDSTGSPLQSDVVIYEEIWDKVWNFQGLMEWWENTQLEIITQRLTHALKKVKKPEETAREGIFKRALKCTRTFFSRCVNQVKKSWRAEIQQFLNGYLVPRETPPAVIESLVVHHRESDIVLEETPEPKEIKKHFFETIVEKLVTEVLLKNKVNLTAVEPNNMIRHLFEMAWPEIEGLDFEATKEMAKSLERNLLKDLCKTLGGVERVFMNLSSTKEDDALGQMLFRSFERQVSPPKRDNSIFSSVGNH
ncbi:uncharacterized protein [Clinocottus analis]|uniref:uncharacterized protein n=1 Tax=Clinocottus analis TaxID=304258 RepID=UPI0035C176AA